MAAIATWQQTLRAEVLSPVIESIESFEQGNEMLPDSQRNPAIQATVSTVTWSLVMLGKSVEQLDRAVLLDPERVRLLVRGAFCAAIQKVAKQKLAGLELVQRFFDMRDAYFPEEQVTMEDGLDEKGFVVVECKTGSSNRDQIDLLKEWIQDPTPLLSPTLQPKSEIKIPNTEKNCGIVQFSA